MTSCRLVSNNIMTLYSLSTYQNIEVTESPMSKQQCLQLMSAVISSSLLSTFSRRKSRL